MAAFSDELLMAYADGELDSATNEAVAEALRSDTELNRRYLAFARTGRDLGQPFADFLNEPAPASIVAMINAHETKVLPKRAPLVPKRETWAEWLSNQLLPAGGMGWAAAGYGLALVAGIGAGALIGGVHGPAGDGSTVGAGLSASGALASALETGHSGVARPVGLSGQAAITPRLTFKTASGDFCRQYAMTLPGGTSEEGVACRTHGKWTVHAHGPGATAAITPGATVPAAGAGSALVEAVVDGLIAGNVLTVEEEAMALGGQWRQ